MDQLQFHRTREAIQVYANPGTGADLTDVEHNLRTELRDSGLFEEVEVEHTDDPDQLVIGLCRFRHYFTEADIASRLEELWADRVRYPFWEAHAIQTDEGQVEFQAASRSGPSGHFVTVHLVAQKARIPAQRTASS